MRLQPGCGNPSLDTCGEEQQAIMYGEYQSGCVRRLAKKYRLCCVGTAIIDRILDGSSQEEETETIHYASGKVEEGETHGGVLEETTYALIYAG
jgi:hypothetical protein